MFEYTITPLEFDRDQGYLKVELIPVDETLTSQVTFLSFTQEKLDEINALSTLEEQKALIRKEIVKYNEGYQHTWQKEKIAKNYVIPEALEALIGVDGTTPVTEAEASAVNNEVQASYSEVPVIV
jgi:hypothetical protein